MDKKKERNVNKIKLFVNIGINLIGTILIIVFLFFMQTEAACKKQYTNSVTKLDEVVKIMVTNATQKQDVINSYDQTYIDKANTIAYLIKTDADVQTHLRDENRENALIYAKDLITNLAAEENFDLDSIHFFEVTSRQQVSYIKDATEITLTLDTTSILPFLTDTINGVTTIKNEFIPFNYNHSANTTNQLPYIIDTPSETEMKDNFILRYYGCKISDDLIVFIGQKPQTLYNNVNNLVSLNNILSDVTVGNEGYIFALSKDNKFAYFPDNTLIGKDAYYYGLNDKNTEDGYSGWININKKKTYCVSLELTEDRIKEKFNDVYKESFDNYVIKNNLTSEQASVAKNFIIS